MTTAGFVRLPDDAANTGKKVRTRTRVVGSDTVHEHYFVPVYWEDILGLYYGHSGVLTVLSSAHSSILGFVYLQNPVGSGVDAYLRQVRFQASPIDATVFDSAPRVTLERFTFTGTASGAQVTPAKRDSADATNTIKLRTAGTDMTITAGNIIKGFIVPCVMTAVGVGVPTEVVWEPSSQEGEVVVKPGEGLILRQADAGTTSDTRIVIADFTWLEV